MAMAPEQTGIGIRRHFTTEAVDPYDEVLWEKRDARITNFRDGTIAFEQRDVEFPIAWSQNATNIVAQKYFRGPLGAPERERSLRQVVDRVADTITAWGAKDGYFVDDDEAQAFRSELKHLVLHQKAAFNSPVWFNIGVKGEPQQASACQPWHALVSTPEGLVPIGRLVEERAVGAKVFDANGLTRVAAVKSNGRKFVLRIHTRTGHTLDVTADHLVWRSRGGDGGFVPAGELERGDRLEWHRSESWGDGEIAREQLARAALAGWLQSDGFVARELGPDRSLAVEALTVSDAERQWVIDAIDVSFPGVHRHEDEVPSDQPGVECRRLRIVGTDVARFAEEWGLRARTIDAGVPAQLFAAPLPVVAAYLRSLFQAEGYLSVRERNATVGLAMASEQLVRGIQTLLMRFGVFSRIRYIADRRPTRDGCWVLNISVAADGRRFADDIGFVDPEKASQLETVAANAPEAGAPAVKALEIDRVEAIGEMAVYDIQTESGEYLSGNVRVHNCFILAVEDTMRSILNWYVEEGTIFKGGSGSGINLSGIRSSQEQLKGGGIASGPVSFMRGADASAGTIKSAGKTRRAAKMVILDADHPDVEDFIWCKAIEERKARVLRDAGFDMDLDGKDSHSTQYQNANNSVRLTDDFMQAVLEDADWPLRAVTTGDALRVLKARDLFHQIALAAWECADPGVQFDTTINRWHTASNTGRINASNPCCFVGETLVDTADGLVAIELLYKTTRAGQALPNAASCDPDTGQTVSRRINAVWVAGHTDRLVEVATEAGLTLRCTPEHRFLTSAAEFVEARRLSPGIGLAAVSDDESAALDPVLSVHEVILAEPVAVYDLEVDGTHNFAVASDGCGAAGAVIVHNSEYMHLDNSACNLASLNLLKFLGDDGTFDVDGFKSAVEVMFTAQEILVGNADYPTEKIGENARRFRQLGLGYANLGALLMALGLPYDSNQGRAWAASITSLMTGHAYATSARTASRMGPFAGYTENRDPMNRVLRMHRDEAAHIDEEMVPVELLSAAQQSWDTAVELGNRYGVRNAQASVLAPTGTIGLMMDCDTTGVEPDLGLCKTKKLVGGGTMSIVNQTVPRALRRMGYSPEQVAEIIAYIDENKSIVGAPHLTAEHLPVFACSMGDNVIHYQGHVRMMGATQPFISGAISKCISGDSLLATADGLVRIGSLHRDEAPDSFRDEIVEVASLHGSQKTDAFYYGGVRPARRVVLRSGHSVTGTPNHKVLVAEGGALAWKRLDQLHHGDHVATKYGDDLWSTLPARFDDFAPSSAYGSQKRTSVPREMTEELALLLGAYAAEGRTTRSNWTITISNTVPEVLDRVVAAWHSEFGLAARAVHQPGRRPGVIVASKTAVEFLEYLGCGARASAKRIPDAVLLSPRSMVLGFLGGLALDACASVTGAPNWGICVDSPRLLDDLQAVLTNLGVVHGRTSKRNKLNGRNTADVVPGMTPLDLYRLVPYRQYNVAGRLLRTEFNFLHDHRTAHVSRRTLERVAAIPGVELPDWLQTVLDDNLHFSPVELVVDAGEREVFDVSVPTTHAFVGNGIVNHNTVNVPEDATVEDVEQLHVDAWRLGVKAIAIYRDNCKVAQPLATTKKDKAVAALTAPVGRLTETATVKEPVRERLPRTRSSKTFSFRVADCHGYVTVGEYEDGRPGEIFLRVAKQGSTLAGIMDAFAISVSHGLQYGVPLKAFVDMYTNMRFEPAGMTDDPDIRFASSLVDYIFRRLAVEFLPFEDRAEMGILTIGERTQPTLPGVEEQSTPTSTGSEVVPDPAPAPARAPAAPAATPPVVRSSAQPVAADAPYCYQCGMVMQRAGACFVCSSCGTTSGCS